MHGSVNTLSPVAAPRRRTRPKRVCCFLPVWGAKYLHEFLSINLPTWLAPGNIPALAAALPTEFVFLTSRDDAAFLAAQPGYHRLSQICATKIQYIDHLITGSTHTATLTLAFAEAIRARGQEMLDTCFFFLMSDYVVADGSFGNALARMIKGASGVQAGNFQLDEGDALPWLSQRLKASPDVLSLSSDEMVRWGLQHLHPATVANIVNYGLIHNSHTNRLFWRVDAQTMIGRFFLIHMVCIRPETTDFFVGSSADYSFIPEMCPSGNVETITDSSEYFVVEMQPRDHEAQIITLGPLRPRRLARSLNEWTTAHHRDNVATTVVYHAGPLPDTLPAMIAQADGFLSQTMRCLRAKPVSHRNHPYWAGAIASIKESTGFPLPVHEWGLAFGAPSPGRVQNPIAARLIRHIPDVLYKTAPHLRIWHPRQASFEIVIGRLEALRRGRSKLLLLAERPTALTVPLADGGNRTVRFRTTEFMRRSPDNFRPLRAAFDLCLIEGKEDDLEAIDRLLDRVAPLMAKDGTILISVFNPRGYRSTRNFNIRFATAADRLSRPYVTRSRFQYVVTPKPLLALFSVQSRLLRYAHKNRSVGAGLIFALLAPAFFAGNVLQNLLARKSTAFPGHKAIGSVLVELDIDDVAAREMTDFSGRPISGQIEPDPLIGHPPPIDGIIFPAVRDKTAASDR